MKVVSSHQPSPLTLARTAAISSHLGISHPPLLPASNTFSNILSTRLLVYFIYPVTLQAKQHNYMHTVSRKRRCLGIEPMMDEDTMLPVSAGPVNAHQRGRRRSPAPVPPPHARYDPSAMLFSLAMTSAHPTSAATSAQAPRARASRQQTPSGGNGTFRGRRRYRSPSLSITSSASASTATATATATAIRKASARPHTPSSRSTSLLKSMSMSMSKSQSKSRPTSPLSRGAGSRGRTARGDSSSPRRVIFRATVDMDHSVYPYFHSHHYQQQQQQHHLHHHHHAHLHPFSVKKARRAHCPSRPGSVDGTETRRRQRTRSRPRYTKDAVSEITALTEICQRSHPSHPARQTSHDSQNRHINLGSVAGGISKVAVSSVNANNDSASISPSHTRSQCHMLFLDSSSTNSDGDAMDTAH